MLAKENPRSANGPNEPKMLRLSVVCFRVVTRAVSVVVWGPVVWIAAIPL